MKLKQILSLVLAICMLASCIPAVIAEEKATLQNSFANQLIPITNLDAFENDYTGYVTQLTTFQDKSVRKISRDGSDNTAFNFCMYKWGTPKDENGDMIPLSTAKYIIIEYYYESPDAEPALVGNKFGWIQGRICPADNISKIIEFSWGTKAMSENGMIANKWDTLVIPLAAHPTLESLIERTYSDELHYLHQMKLFPLQADMGKNDALYIGDITVQSWDPAGESGIMERTVRFYNTANDAEYPEKAAKSVTAKDTDSIEIPAFTAASPANSEFKCWLNVQDGMEYYPEDTYKLLLGADIDFVPVFNYIFDFSAVESAYINGYTDGSFLPQNNVTRAEAVKILASLLPEIDTGFASYTKVPADQWYHEYFAKLDALDALEIFGDELDPDKPITRSELVELVYAVSDKSSGSMKLTYISDIKSSDRFYDAVMYAVSSGIITGYEDGTFKPENNITRAEAVTVINRMLGRVPSGTGAEKFSDIADHWAKDQIIASSSAKSEGAWTISTAAKEYVLEGTNATEYINSLYSQSKTLLGDAVRRGIDVVAEQMKKDILSTPNTAELYPERFTGNTYYVSEKNGNDDNDGKSPETAVKTIAGLNSKLRFPGAGTAILFERGGLYRGQINVITGLTYGSYGEGDKPVISGSLKNYANPDLWVETDAPNVYQLTDKIKNVGIIVFDHAQDAHGNYDDLYGQNRIFGKNIADYKGLTKDLEFFSCDDTFYLCSTEGNPGSRFKSIEMGRRADVFDGNGNNILIDNLHVKHTGAHGIGLGSVKNLRVTNCEFSWLGGSLLGNYGETTTQYGNAVEVYGNIDGYYVKNNWMYQIYDTAVTHQGNDLKMYNIEYSDNLMELVHWGIECWINKQNTTDTQLHDYYAHHNVLRAGGYGWGSIVTKRQDSARLYSFSTVNAKNSNLKCEYNVIDRCSGYLLDIDSRSTETFDSNIYVQDEGHTLGGLKGKAVTASKTAAEDVYKNLKDENEIFVLIPAR